MSHTPDENVVPSTSTTTSSASSERFNLSPTSTAPILVYKYRSGNYTITTQRELCRDLDADPKWRCSRKPISRGTSRLEVHVRDLFNEPEKTQYSKYPNQSDSVASVGLPRKVYWRRLLLGQFEELYILSLENGSSTSSLGKSSGASPEDGNTGSSTSPTSNSPDDEIGPSGTWRAD